jgi:Holliday junction resolvase-like predicted endonuclease
MTAKEVFELRQQKLTEQAYEAARQVFASDKSPYATSAMFWTAVDMLKLCLQEERIEEANKIFLALERLLPNVPDREGWVKTAFARCEQLLRKSHTKKAGYDDISEHSQMGTWGEEIAAEYLRDQGYVIMERDWHSGHRDIDIIACKDGFVVFVEVKTRRNTDFSTPEQAVDWKKRRNLRHAITHYMNYRKIDSPTRFDIITVVGSLGSLHPTINHIEDVDIMR